MLDGAKVQHKIRLSGVGALEMAKAFADRAKENLPPRVRSSDRRELLTPIAWFKLSPAKREMGATRTIGVSGQDNASADRKF